jgi:ferredoxin
MTEQTFKTLIFYCSPAGTTRHAAEVIAKNLQSKQQETVICEIGRDEPHLTQVLQSLADTDEQLVVFIGSPVYASHALPLIMELIDRLPVKDQVYAVPFVTWGGATSGLALEEMEAALTAKGYGVIAAAKVLAVHSLMWQQENPVAAGHPNQNDDSLIMKLVMAVEKNMAQSKPKLLTATQLEYQPREMAAEMRKLNLKIAKTILPQRTVNQEKCTQCGECEVNCPTTALTLTPWPDFADNCIGCFNCVRLCPENAIEADLTPIYDRIHERAEAAREGDPTQIYLP